MNRQYVGLIIRNDAGEYLTIHHSKKAEHPWRFAGGKIDAGELPIVAAARELFEELGVVATSMQLVEVTDDHFTDGVTWNGHFFEVLSYTGEPRLMEPEKHDTMQYVDAFELRRLDSHPEYEVALNQIAPTQTSYSVTASVTSARS